MEQAAVEKGVGEKAPQLFPGPKGLGDKAKGLYNFAADCNLPHIDHYQRRHERQEKQWTLSDRVINLDGEPCEELEKIGLCSAR